MKTMNPEKLQVGWREWLALPALGIGSIKAKVDTGARTSALHTRGLTVFVDRGVQMVQFEVNPHQYDAESVLKCQAEISDRRWVMDSGGHRELRYVISTPVLLGQRQFPIEMTLTDRDPMRFRMLLGRTGMPVDFTIRPHVSYLLGKPEKL